MAACDIICLEVVILLGGVTMDRLYHNGNRRKFAIFTSRPVLVIELL